MHDIVLVDIELCWWVQRGAGFAFRHVVNGAVSMQLAPFDYDGKKVEKKKKTLRHVGQAILPNETTYNCLLISN